MTDAETDDPIMDAVVHVYDPDNKRSTYQNTSTDRSGQYEVTVDPGHYEILIEKDGYESHKGEENVSLADVQHDAELEPEVETYVEGYVTDNATGDPIGGAEVTLYSRSRDSSKGDDRKAVSDSDQRKDDDKEGGSLSANTDRSGYYNISCREETYYISAAKDGYESHKGQVEAVEGGTRYDVALDAGNDDVNGGKDGTDGGDDGGNGGDDGSDDHLFEIAGQDGVMVTGWLLVIVLLLFLMIGKVRRRNAEIDGAIQKRTEAREATPVAEKAAPPPSGTPSCPQCGTPSTFYEQYGRHYCQNCKGYLPK